MYLLTLPEMPDEKFGFECVNFFKLHWVCLISATNASLLMSSYAGMSGALMERNSPVVATCQHTSAWHLAAISTDKHPPQKPYVSQIRLMPFAKRVYVLDTAADCSHEDLRKRCWRAPIFETYKPQAHGTHVAGIIAGSRYGVSSQTQIVSVAVLNDNNYGSWWQILKGLEWVSRQNPVGVVNLSLAGDRSEAVNRAIRTMTSRGWIVVVAAGNDGRDACLYSPASETSAITVASANMLDEFSDFSNYGPCVDLVAPGEAILSTLPGGAYGYMSGTSMASPIVAGLMSRNDLISNPGYVHRLPRGTVDKLAFASLRNSCFVLQ